jgi:hypothetical protein
MNSFEKSLWRHVVYVVKELIIITISIFFFYNRISCLLDVLVVAMFGVVVTQEMNIVVAMT